MTRNEQILHLRKMASSNGARWLASGCAAISVAGLLLGLHSGSPPYYMASAFAALIAWSAYRTTPHIVRAAKALQSSARQAAEIAIEISEWSDSPTYHAVVTLDSRPTWRMTFIPQGWTPKQGAVQGAVYFVPDVEWPVLLETEEGIIHPRYTPIRSAANAAA